jgi:hypothetical protein
MCFDSIGKAKPDPRPRTAEELAREQLMQEAREGIHGKFSRQLLDDMRSRKLEEMNPRSRKMLEALVSDIKEDEVD